MMIKEYIWKTYAYGTKQKDLIHEKEEVKCNNVIKQNKND